MSTGTIEGWEITSYRGMISSHVVAGTGFVSDFAAGLTDFFGGRSATYQRQFASLQEEVEALLMQRARLLGANWVVGARIDFDSISGKGMQMLMVSATGTAVIARPLRANEDVASKDTHLATADSARTFLARQALVRATARGELVWNTETWAALIHHQVDEAIGTVLALIRDSQDAAVHEEARRFLRCLPAESVQVCLHAAMLKDDQRLLATSGRLLIELDLVSLSWIADHLSAKDQLLRKWALALLRGYPRYFSEEDLPRLAKLELAIQTEFPDRSTALERKTLITRKVETWWMCAGCLHENPSEAEHCMSCRLDKRGFYSEDFKPASALERVRALRGAVEAILSIPAKKPETSQWEGPELRAPSGKMTPPTMAE
ncbi:MAG: YbjQ family protein [Planctomycetota bacterium]